MSLGRQYRYYIIACIICHLSLKLSKLSTEALRAAEISSSCTVDRSGSVWRSTKTSKFAQSSNARRTKPRRPDLIVIVCDVCWHQDWPHQPFEARSPNLVIRHPLPYLAPAAMRTTSMITIKQTTYHYLDYKMEVISKLSLLQRLSSLSLLQMALKPLSQFNNM